MGKGKKNKAFYKKALKPFKGSKVIWAALGGMATGIALSGILGSEKAKQLADTVTDSMKDFSNKIKDEMTSPKAHSA